MPASLWRWYSLGTEDWAILEAGSSAGWGPASHVVPAWGKCSMDPGPAGAGPPRSAVLDWPRWIPCGMGLGLVRVSRHFMQRLSWALCGQFGSIWVNPGAAQEPDDGALKLDCSADLIFDTSLLNGSQRGAFHGILDWVKYLIDCLFPAPYLHSFLAYKNHLRKLSCDKKCLLWCTWNYTKSIWIQVEDFLICPSSKSE